MSFLALAERIDKQNSLVDEASKKVYDAEVVVEEIKAKLAIELSEAQDVVDSLRLDHENSTNLLNALYKEMQHMINPAATPPKPEREEPSTAELKKIFLEGQKLRNK